MLEAATKVLRFVQDDFLAALDELEACHIEEMNSIEDIKACADNLDLVHMQLRNLLLDPDFAYDLRRMEGLQGVDCLSQPAAPVLLDMTPRLIEGVYCYTRKQFAQALGVTPQRVSQLLNYNRLLVRLCDRGHLYIPVGEVERKYEWGKLQLAKPKEPPTAKEKPVKRPKPAKAPKPFFRPPFTPDSF